MLRFIVCRYLFLSTVLTHNDVSSQDSWRCDEKRFLNVADVRIVLSDTWPAVRGMRELYEPQFVIGDSGTEFGG